MPKDVTLPCVSQTIVAQDTVNLHVPSWVLDGVYWMDKQVVRETQDIEVAICCGTGVEYQV